MFVHPLRLDTTTKDVRTLAATLEYARRTSAHRATVGAEAPENWQPAVLGKF